MPRFQKLNPKDVVLGRGRSALIERRAYTDALRHAQAGSITLDKTDSPARVKRLLKLAARDLGVRVRSSWEDASQRVLLWKRSG